jgi:hypothetical protein
MTFFATQVKLAGERIDINLVSETVLIPLFADVYGYENLENLNLTEGKNYPGIDLGDKTARVAIQVTATANSEKVKDTLRTFVKYKLYEQYDKLIIYILTEKQQSYSGRGYQEMAQDKFVFDKNTDILDARDVLRQVNSFQIDKAYRIEQFLEANFGDGTVPWYQEPKRAGAVAKWISSRGYLNLIVVSAQTTLKRWTQSELDYELRDVPRLVYTFVPDPNRTVGRIRTAFTVLEFLVTHLYRQPLVVQRILIEPNESVSCYKIGSHAPPYASRYKTQDNYWVFDLKTREPVSLAELVILEPGESIGRRIEFRVRSDAPANWQGSYFFTHVPEDKILTTARITVSTNRETRTFVIPVEVKDYSDVSRELYEEHQDCDPRFTVTTWHQGAASWITDNFPRRTQEK